MTNDNSPYIFQNIDMLRSIYVYVIIVEIQNEIIFS